MVQTRIVVVGAGLLLLALITADRVPDWTDERQLWASAVAHSPAKPRPLVNLGAVYQRHGRIDLADAAFRQASIAAQSPARAPDEQVLGRAIADTNLAILAINRGDLDGARQQLHAVILRAPTAQTPPRLYAWIARRQSSSPASSSSR